MGFSKEDRVVWENSEVMKELEKFADEVLYPSNEAYEPIEENHDWEEEKLNEEKLTDAAAEFNENSFEDELRIAYDKQLIYKLEKLAEQLADKSNIKAAYRVERTIQELKALMREEYDAKH